jgi:aspartate racemase
MKTLGIIGGMGPEATARFYELFTVLDSVSSDQGHPDAVIFSRPSVPDRTRWLLGLSDESPVPHIIAMGQALEKLGAEALVIPCFTSHCCIDEIQARLNVPVINMVSASILELKRRRVTSAGLMATDGTAQTGLFERAFAEDGDAITLKLPDSANQAKLMTIIYEQIKAHKAADMALFGEVSEELFAQGAEAIILGCTELSLIARDFPLDPRFIDPLVVTALKALEFCKS